MQSMPDTESARSDRKICERSVTSTRQVSQKGETECTEHRVPGRYLKR